MCVALLAVGAACERDDQCASGSCITDLHGGPLTCIAVDACPPP